MGTVFLPQVWRLTSDGAALLVAAWLMLRVRPVPRDLCPLVERISELLPLTPPDTCGNAAVASRGSWAEQRSATSASSSPSSSAHAAIHTETTLRATSPAADRAAETPAASRAVPNTMP